MNIRPRRARGGSRSGRPAVFVAHDIYRHAAYGKLHPLAIARVEAVVDLCTALGWLPRSEYCESPCATPAQLRWFHDADYIRALRDASATGSVDVDTRRRYGIGTMENPLFPGVFERASTSIGGSIRAAELALEGKIAFHPAGGTHHGRPDRASGFCYFNDPVFAILRLLQGGLERILYVDLDAHHGDGVQDAFANESRVHTISIHESGRWPHTGAVTDTGTGRACNAPVPSNFHDAEFALLVDSIVLPLAARVEPDAVVVTCGGDALAGDPLTSMALSNVALWDTVLRLAACAPAVVVLGGGGYNPWTLTRYWAGLWGRLSGRTIPALLTEPAKQVLQRLRCDLIDDEDVRPEWLCCLADVPAAKPVRSAVRSLCEQLLAQNGIGRGRVRRSTSVGKDALEPEPNRVARAAGQRAMIAGGRR